MNIYNKSKYIKMWMLSYPLMIANLSLVFLNFIDIKMIGSLGKDAVAAVGISLSLIWLIQVPVIESFMDNAIIYFTKAFALKDWNKLGQLFRQENKVALLIGTVTLLFILPFKIICEFMAESDNIESLAFQYCLIIMIGFPICAIGSISMRLLLAVNKNRIISIFSILGVIINLILDYVLIFGKFGFPQLGISGAALGTLTAKILENIGVYITARGYIYKKQNIKIVTEKSVYKDIVNSSSSLMAASFAESWAWCCFTIIVSRLGTTAIASQESVMRLKDIAYVPNTAISNVAASVVGQENGRNNKNEAKSAGISCIHLSLVITSIFSLVFFIIPESLVGFLIADKQVIQLGAHLLRFIAVYQLIDVTYTILKGCMRGLNQVRCIRKYTMIFSWGVWIPSSIIFSYVFKWGLLGAWLSLGIFALSLAAIYLYQFLKETI